MGTNARSARRAAAGTKGKRARKAQTAVKRVPKPVQKKSGGQ
jgi:hypothetical protein